MLCSGITKASVTDTRQCTSDYTATTIHHTLKRKNVHEVICLLDSLSFTSPPFVSPMCGVNQQSKSCLKGICNLVSFHW